MAAHGLLQNLQVRPGAKGKYEVVADGRRLVALKRPAKAKTIASTEEIVCQVMNGEDASEISLAENIVRLPIHLADQYDALKALADQGKGPQEIAARFGRPWSSSGSSSRMSVHASSRLTAKTKLILIS